MDAQFMSDNLARRFGQDWESANITHQTQKGFLIDREIFT